MKGINQLIATALVLLMSAALGQAQSAQKQSTQTQPAAGTSPVSGSGTIGQLSKWVGTSGSTYVLGDSGIFEDKFFNVGIGTTAPASKLTVRGVADASPVVLVTNAGNGGIGIETLGGDGTARRGGAGIKATGGNSFGGSAGGEGINAFGGAGRGGGIGVFGQGGTGTVLGGPGVVGLGAVAPAGGREAGAGIAGTGGAAVGTNLTAGIGVYAQGGNASGAGSRGGVGLYVFAGLGNDGATTGLAGEFFGSVKINKVDNTGNLSVEGNLNVSGTKNFKIDHPLDPENKYLYHAAVESSEVLNVYSGNVTTDGNGDAVVQLPDWFEALNRDFRYQLTVIGSFNQAIVAGKIKNNAFAIRTNGPGVEVSWQVTGVRNDAMLKAHPFKVEEEKAEPERGYYLAPDAYGLPEEKGIGYAHNPELMSRVKATREKAERRPE